MKTTKQIKFSVIFVILAIAIAAGCKNDGIVEPNNLNNQVSFQISQQYGQNGGVDFLFHPSVDVKISRVICMYQAQQFTDTLNNQFTGYVYSKDSVYFINEYVGVQIGQQWNFNFTGSLPGQNNSNFDVTCNYTVQ